jgi:hypothetical protein
MSAQDYFNQLPTLVRQFFTLDPTDPFKIGAKVLGMLGAGFTIITTLATKTYPWLRAKRDSRVITNRVGAQLIAASNIERTIRNYIPL